MFYKSGTHNCAIVLLTYASLNDRCRCPLNQNTPRVHHRWIFCCERSQQGMLISAAWKHRLCLTNIYSPKISWNIPVAYHPHGLSHIQSCDSLFCLQKNLFTEKIVYPTKIIVICFKKYGLGWQLLLERIYIRLVSFLCIWDSKLACCLVN